MMKHDIVLVLMSGDNVVGVIHPDNETGVLNFIESLCPEGVTRIEIREVDTIRL